MDAGFFPSKATQLLLTGDDGGLYRQLILY
jgi:hypothetical protein